MRGPEEDTEKTAAGRMEAAMSAPPSAWRGGGAGRQETDPLGAVTH